MAKQESHMLTAAQILKLGRMKGLNLNPAYGGELVLPVDPREGTSPVVKTNGMEIKITLAEAFKL